jgi:hypothetical protein
MKGKAKQRLLLRVGVIGLAVLVALIAWLATRSSGGSGGESVAPESSSGRIVSEAQLGETAAKLGQPVYWAGTQAGNELELTELSEGGTQVRYVPEGTEVAEGSAALLTIGSYPVPNPKKALEGFAKRPGSIVHHAKDGTEVLTSEGSPTSVYFVSPDNSVQVEVYDPSPQRAMSLALSGRAQPVP